MNRMTAFDRRAQNGEVTGDPDPEVPLRAKPPRSYSARYKAEILAEYETLDKAGKGVAPPAGRGWSTTTGAPASSSRSTATATRRSPT